MRDELLNGRLAREFDQETFAHKDTELRDEEARLKDQIDAIDDYRTDGRRHHNRVREVALDNLLGNGP